MDNLYGEGVFLGNFHPIVGQPTWLQMINLHQTWYVTSLSMSDYCCGVRKFWPPFVWCLWTKTNILSLK